MLNIKNLTLSNLARQRCQGCLVAELTPKSKSTQLTVLNIMQKAFLKLGQ